MARRLFISALAICAIALATAGCGSSSDDATRGARRGAFFFALPFLGGGQSLTLGLKNVTTNTGTVLIETRRSVTLPKTNLRMPLRPCVAMTIKSAPDLLACPAISSAARPARTDCLTEACRARIVVSARCSALRVSESSWVSSGAS